MGFDLPSFLMGLGAGASAATIILIALMKCLGADGCDGD